MLVRVRVRWRCWLGLGLGGALHLEMLRTTGGVEALRASGGGSYACGEWPRGKLASSSNPATEPPASRTPLVLGTRGMAPSRTGDARTEAPPHQFESSFWSLAAS
eukprot:scaffold72276_cov69-Phaeocystis_antarctica.AAC.1